MQKKIISVVCIANYCRSPVAEALLKQKYQNEYEIESYGIQPIAKADMDPRSRKFLESMGVKPQLHNPKRLNSSIISKSSLVLAMDHIVLMGINRLIKNNNASNIRLFNFQYKSKIIRDPYRYDSSSYNNVMNDIKLIDHIDLRDNV